MTRKFHLKGAKVVGNTLDPEPHAGMIVEAEEVSDGYHTMHELYQHRRALNIALFHAWNDFDFGISVMKSKLHYDGTMFEGDYFIVMAILPDGKQISYHYQMKHWDEFQIREVERIPVPYDGSTPSDTIERLVNL